MKTKIIEAVEDSKFNWGKFMVAQFEPEEWAYRSEVDGARLLSGRGWGECAGHMWVMDLQTGEGAIFAVRQHGYPKADLNERHQIWVCPLFEPFLEWLYQQDVSDLNALPALVNLGHVPVAFRGYRRQRKSGDLASSDPLTQAKD